MNDSKNNKHLKPEMMVHMKNEKTKNSGKKKKIRPSFFLSYRHKMTIVTSINVSVSSQYFFNINIIGFFLYLPKVVFPSTKKGKLGVL